MHKLATLGFVFVALSVLAFSRGVFAEEKHDEHAHGAHGGVILEVGEEVAHIEFVHVKDAGKVELYILGPDAKTALALKDAPKLNLKTAAGGKVFETIAIEPKDGAASHFRVTDEALKQAVKGRVNIVIGGKKYNAEIKAH